MSNYRIDRRTRRKDGKGDLSGFAIDITIRANGSGHLFVQDHNGTLNTMPFDSSLGGMAGWIASEIQRNYAEHFGTP
jgi:hypothetical protein